jgi:hypothetical protein
VPDLPATRGGLQEGNGVLLDHKGKELCLPEAALKGHLKHGDEVIDEEGCSDPAAKKNGRNGHEGMGKRGGNWIPQGGSDPWKARLVRFESTLPFSDARGKLRQSP